MGGEFFHDDGRTDMTKPTVAFRDFAIAHNKMLQYFVFTICFPNTLALLSATACFKTCLHAGKSLSTVNTITQRVRIYWATWTNWTNSIRKYGQRDASVMHWQPRKHTNQPAVHYSSLSTYQKFVAVDEACHFCWFMSLLPPYMIPRNYNQTSRFIKRHFTFTETRGLLMSIFNNPHHQVRRYTHARG